MSTRYEIIYECFGDKPKICRLFQALYGHKVRSKLADGTLKEYVYDGVLAGWKRVGDNYIRVKIVDYEKHANSVISLTGDTNIKDRVLEVFKRFGVDHRVIEYNSRRNYYRKTYYGKRWNAY